MSSSPVSRRRQKIHSSSPTSVNANVSLITGRNYSQQHTQQQHNKRGRIISSVQRKRYVGIVCIVIATLCALQHFRVKTLAPDENKTELNDHHNHAIGGSSSMPPLLDQQQMRHSSVKFIPYPHRTLGSGDSIKCEWETRSNYNTPHLDFTQRNALTEGICIPPSLSNTIHIFSSDEAIQCLSSKIQQREIRVILAGDSYMKQMYIGLADILLSKHISEDKEMKDNIQRSKILAKAQYWVMNRHETNETSFPYAQYLCEEECYGKKALDKCSQCINNNTRVGKDDVWVVGVGIHIYARSNKQVDFTVEKIQQFLETEEEYKRTIYVSPPHFFQREDYPTQSKNMERVYHGLLPNVAPEQPAHPFLDVYQLTKSCTWGNCTFDGGHRSRFVNRWKAQLLLNTLCEVN